MEVTRLSGIHRKPNTDVSYIACAKKMLQARDVIIDGLPRITRYNRAIYQIGKKKSGLQITNISACWHGTRFVCRSHGKK